ncbi:MAG: 4Fe-4S binding protein [Kiritimatiellaeota bacterium]|nr:4Fe-4S binding protein [Kiritimatiellota bacterium]
MYCGRIFCTGGCPLGAVQEVLQWRSVTLPRWLVAGLRWLPYLVLAMVSALAASGFGYWLCRWDPFVGLFRPNGAGTMVVVGLGAIGVNLVLPRFFCRWVCPYGAVLRVCSMVAAWRVSVSPARCVNCHLCREACPVEAIVAPVPRPTPQEAATGLGKVQWAVALLPLIIVVAILAGLCIGHGVSGQWSVVSGQHRFTMGVFAVAFGVVAALAGVEWIYRLRKRPEGEYSVEQIDCVCCGRCYGACPVKMKNEA